MILHKGGIYMPQTEAQKRAKAKYDAKTYDTIATKAKKDDIEKCKQYAEKIMLTPSKFALQAMLYCIEHEIRFDVAD